MTEYVVTNNFGNANSIIARMNSLMGYPNSPTKTYRYTTPRVHHADRRKNGAKRYLVIIKEVWAPALGRNATVFDINGNLNPGERNTIKDRDTLEPENAFNDGLIFTQTLDGDQMQTVDGDFIKTIQTEEVI